MRTISLDSVAVNESAQSRHFANSASQASSQSNLIITTVAVLQAAFNKAASTNAMLADVLSAPGAAGSPSTGACYQRYPTSRNTFFSTRRAISRQGGAKSRGTSGLDARYF